MSNWTEEEIQKTITEIQGKAGTDEKFRALCLSNIGEAIKQVSGKEIPAEYKINVVEGNADFDQTLVLPPMMSGSLSDEQLDKVAGGYGPGYPFKWRPYGR